MWCYLAIIVEPKHRIGTCMVMIDKKFTNLNKLDQIDEFNSKVKNNLYKLFDKYINQFGGSSSSMVASHSLFVIRENDDDSTM